MHKIHTCTLTKWPFGVSIVLFVFSSVELVFHGGSARWISPRITRTHTSSLHSIPAPHPLARPPFYVCVCVMREIWQKKESGREWKSPGEINEWWETEEKDGTSCDSGNKGWNQARHGKREEGRRKVILRKKREEEDKPVEGGVEGGWVVAHVTVNYFKGLITADSQVSLQRRGIYTL